MRRKTIALACVLCASAMQTGQPVAAAIELPVTRIAETDTVGRAVLKVGDESTSIEMNIGQILEVRLPASLGAGLSWQLVGNVPTFLHLIAQSIERDLSEGREGAPEIQVFSFRAIAADEGSLTFAYGRPWLANDKPRKLVVDTVIARP